MWDVLVGFLLLCPVEVPVPHHAPPAAWTALKRASMVLEITGPQERWIEDFRSELGYVRRNLRELRTAPGLAECERFPASETAIACLRVNAAYARYLELRMAVRKWQEDELSDALAETHRIWQFWQLVRDANRLTYYWAGRRQSLKALLELLGPDDFYAGRLPPAVPIWRFRLAD